MLLASLLKGKCPRCRKGAIFVQKSVFPLNSCLQVQEYCSCCGQKIKVEHNYGQGMNFVFIIILFILIAVFYALVWGLSFRDNSIFCYLGISVVGSLLLQPWLMRLSRVLFLFLVVPYEKNADSVK